MSENKDHHLKNLVCRTFINAIDAGEDELAKAMSPSIDSLSLIRMMASQFLDEDLSLPLMLEDPHKRSLVFGGLIKPYYKPDRINDLFDVNLYDRHKSYREFINGFHEHITGDDQKASFFVAMVNWGMHDAAFNMLSSMDSKEKARDEYQTLERKGIQRGVDAYNRLYDSFNGPLFLSESTLKILDWLDFDLPASLQYFPSGNTFPQNNYNTWNQRRFDAQVNLIGDVCDQRGIGTPRIDVSSGRIVVTHGAELVNAYVAQITRFEQSGDKIDEFPTYMPCHFSTLDEIPLREMGAVIVQPQHHLPGADVPYHGFVDQDGKLERHQVTMSTAMLSRHALSTLLAEGSLLALVPYQAFEPMQCTDPELERAMRYFRPHPVAFYGHNAISYDHLESLGMDLYLKGVPMVDIKHQWHIKPTAKTARDLAYFSTEAEKKYLAGLFFANASCSGGSMSRPRISYGLEFSQTSSDIGWEIERLRIESKMAFNYFGRMPNFRIAGSQAFLEAVSNAKLGLSASCIALTTDGEPQWEDPFAQERMIYRHPRMCARIGAGMSDYIKDGAPSIESILSAANLDEYFEEVVQTQDFEQVLLGRLDRFDLIDVANAVTIAEEARFVCEHYDIKPILKQLKLTSQKLFSRHLLIQGFESSGPSL